MLLSRAVEALEALYPLKCAEYWDAPGLIVGDPLDEVKTLAVAVDPTMPVVDEAIDTHADLLICHHPLFFEPVHEVSGLGFRGEIVARLYRNHCALWVGHTNVDAAPRGIGQAAADAFGLIDQQPLIEHSPLITSKLNPDANQRVGLGRVGRLEHPTSLAEFAQTVAQALPHTELGVQVAGDSNMQVRTVAVMPGSGDSLLDKARAAGVDVYVTSDLKHHPASDAMQQAAYEARLREHTTTDHHAGSPAASPHVQAQEDEDRGSAYPPRPALINTPHSAIESLWTSTYALSDIPNALHAATGELLPIHRVAVNTDPWTERVRLG